MNEITLRELAREELPTILPLIQQLNPHQDPAELERRLSMMIPLNYHCLAAFEGATMVGVCGFWLGTRFWSGEYIDIDNVVVEESRRSQGIGEKMIAWVEAYGRARGCQMAMLDCYVTKYAAHKFYLRQDYQILGYHFAKMLSRP
jgi:GNAT superfamily N-acetyltransferase